MTLLYRLDADAPKIGQVFGIDTGRDPWASGPVLPGRFAPVITAGREFVAGPRTVPRPWRLIPRLWGVPPPPSASDAARPVLTVRNPDSPFWIGNLRNSEFRCIVPATAFMVWGKGSDAAGRRVRHWFGCADQPLFGFAGVWKDSEVPSFAILSCEPNAVLREAGRDAMPAILSRSREAWGLWLTGGWERARAMNGPYPSSLMVEVA